MESSCQILPHAARIDPSITFSGVTPCMASSLIRVEELCRTSLDCDGKNDGNRVKEMRTSSPTIVCDNARQAVSEAFK